MVYVIILNWNNLSDTIGCLASLYSTGETEFHAVVVDNGSTDGSTDGIARWAEGKFRTGGSEASVASYYTKRYATDDGSSLVLIATGRNLGYAGGNNVGIKYAVESADCDYICILNNDVIVDRLFLHNAVSCFVDPGIGIVSPLIAYWPATDTIWYAGGRGFLGNVFHFHRGKSISETSLVPRTVNFATGCAFVARKEVFQKVGYLNENFFLYGEDLEFSRRVLKYYSILFCPSARVFHKVSAVSGGETLNSNFLYYGRRNVKFLAHTIPQKWLYFVADFTIVVIPALLRIMLSGKSKAPLLKALSRGIVGAWK